MAKPNLFEAYVDSLPPVDDEPAPQVIVARCEMCHITVTGLVPASAVALICPECGRVIWRRPRA